MRLATLLAGALLHALPVAARAQPVFISERAQNVAVTVYRAPERPASQAMNLRWLDGYALISETREISIPAGESVIRFEGVASGLIPESAIVTGFPRDIVERNHDAWLLSPASLLDRSLGRRVHLRRASPGGAVREYEAVIRSGAGGAVVLQTEEGFEALRCTGLPETLVYAEVPQGLSARPSLSVRVRSAQPATATVTLSYLATGFDWQANYVAHLSPAGDRVDLFAWVTLASTDATSFPDAETQAVAGRLNRLDDPPRPPQEQLALNLRCWPHRTTSDIAAGDFGDEHIGDAIIVTGTRIGRPNLESNAPVTAVSVQELTARQEELGDLKLYRIPGRVTVAANSQKQVALLDRDDVRVRIVYRQQRWETEGSPTSPAQRYLVTRNRSAEGLGVPLPAGRLVLFATGRERPILVGEGSIEDRAVGEDVEIAIGPATEVHGRLTLLSEAGGWRAFELVVTNALPRAVPFEAWLPDLARDVRSRARLGTRAGRALWTVNVPANGSATLRYRVRTGG